MTPRRPKTAPRRPQDDPKTAPRRPQDVPTRPQDAPKTAPPPLPPPGSPRKPILCSLGADLQSIWGVFGFDCRPIRGRCGVHLGPAVEYDFGSVLGQFGIAFPTLPTLVRTSRRRPQDAPGRPQEALGRPQEATGALNITDFHYVFAGVRPSPHDGPRTAHDSSQFFQDAPKTSQDGPKTAQDAPKTAPDRPGTSQENDLGSIWGRLAIDVGPLWARLRIDSGSIWAPVLGYDGFLAHLMGRSTGSPMMMMMMTMMMMTE